MKVVKSRLFQNHPRVTRPSNPRRKGCHCRSRIKRYMAAGQLGGLGVDDSRPTIYVCLLFRKWTYITYSRSVLYLNTLLAHIQAIKKLSRALTQIAQHVFSSPKWGIEPWSVFQLLRSNSLDNNEIRRTGRPVTDHVGKGVGERSSSV